MNAILGFSELLRTQMAASRERQYLDAISSSGRTLLALINDILDLSKIEAGKLNLQLEPVSVGRVVEEIARLFSIKAGEKGITLETEVDPELPAAVLLDEVRLRQILFNIVGNAIKFTEKGKVRVCVGAQDKSEGRMPRTEARPNGEGREPNRNDLAGSGFDTEASAPSKTPSAKVIELVMEVQDTGIGIPKDQLDSIFWAFQQVSGQSTRKFGGTGLGLTISKRLTEMMGGTITVSSELGKGSMFRIVFPEVTKTDAVPTKTSFADLDGDFSQFAPATILAVDDVALNRSLIAGYLEGAGHKLIQASSGLEALELAEKHRPDVILMDMRMPDMDGYEATRELKANPVLRSIPVIAVTASSFREEEARARKACDGFVRKPFNRAELAAELSRFLKPAQPRRSDTSAVTRHHVPEQVRLQPSAAALNRRPELLAKLREQQKAVWPELSQSLSMDEIEQFAKRLESWAQEGEWAVLREYSATLINEVQQFDLARLPKSLERFPEICDRLGR
jgi:CheY-like chemotaxis protein